MSYVTVPATVIAPGTYVETLTGNSGGAVGPDGSSNINVLGGAGINVVGVPSTHTLTITATGGGFVYTDEGSSFNAASTNGYFVDAAATATMPASPSQGDRIEFIVDTTGSFTVRANTGQTLRIGTGLSAAAGTAVNSARGDAVTFIYRTADTEWLALSVIGTWVVT